MARKSSARTNNASHPSESYVEGLLTPLMTFLSRSGLTDLQIVSLCGSALKKGKIVRSGPKVTRIGPAHDSSIIVARWLRDPTYLNRAGRPEDLPLRGRLSVSSLLKDCGIGTSPAAALNVLLKFNTARRIANGKYRLTKRYMNYSIPGVLPFEPNMQFMTAAVRATTRGLGVDKPQPRVFCKWVDNVCIPRRFEADFSHFAERRGLAFLHEVNDWLDEHCHLPLRDQPRRRKMSRLGMGLFAIRSSGE
jgi:hypothetical protein